MVNSPGWLSIEEKAPSHSCSSHWRPVSREMSAPRHSSPLRCPWRRRHFHHRPRANRAWWSINRERWLQSSSSRARQQNQKKKKKKKELYTGDGESETVRGWVTSVCLWSTLTSRDVKGATSGFALWQTRLGSSLCSPLTKPLIVCLFFVFQKTSKGANECGTQNGIVEPTAASRHLLLHLAADHHERHLGWRCINRATARRYIEIEFQPFIFWFQSINDTYSKHCIHSTFCSSFFSQSRQRSGRTIARSSVLMWWIESKSLALFISNLAIQLVFSSVGPRYVYKCGKRNCLERIFDKKIMWLSILLYQHNYVYNTIDRITSPFLWRDLKRKAPIWSSTTSN